MACMIIMRQSRSGDDGGENMMIMQQSMDVTEKLCTVHSFRFGPGYIDLLLVVEAKVLVRRVQQKGDESR